MRRREKVLPVDLATVEDRLREFRAEQWPEPGGMELRWPDGDTGWPTRAFIRAHRRWLEARRGWERETGRSLTGLS